MQRNRQKADDGSALDQRDDAEGTCDVCGEVREVREVTMVKKASGGGHIMICDSCFGSGSGSPPPGCAFCGDELNKPHPSHIYDHRKGDQDNFPICEGCRHDIRWGDGVEKQ